METEWKKDILMSKKLCISDKYFRKHSFSFDKKHFLLMGAHYHAAGLPWEALTIWSPYSKIPFISRVVDSSREWLIAPPAPQYQTFPVVTQLYFTGSRVHCPSCVSSPLSYLGRQLAPAPQFGGVYHPSVSGSCVPPSLTSSLAPGMLTAIITRAIYRWRLPGYLEA